jgi:hypothetical protein
VQSDARATLLRVVSSLRLSCDLNWRCAKENLETVSINCAAAVPASIRLAVRDVRPCSAVSFVWNPSKSMRSKVVLDAMGVVRVDASQILCLWFSILVETKESPLSLSLSLS